MPDTRSTCKENSKKGAMSDECRCPCPVRGAGDCDHDVKDTVHLIYLHQLKET